MCDLLPSLNICVFSIGKLVTLLIITQNTDIVYIHTLLVCGNNCHFVTLSYMYVFWLCLVSIHHIFIL